ncbi:DeoR family transcriptional regulator [Kitasatospora sp. DSM 101779]|nr:DeoR family transcriptional regulator [Kitasatospora sp. DSM 101779]
MDQGLLADQRRALILHAVRRDGAVRVSDLASRGVPDMTVRRDLDAPERRGTVEKVHGGPWPRQGAVRTPASTPGPPWSPRPSPPCRRRGDPGEVRQRGRRRRRHDDERGRRAPAEHSRSDPRHEFPADRAACRVVPDARSAVSPVVGPRHGRAVPVGLRALTSADLNFRRSYGM